MDTQSRKQSSIIKPFEYEIVQVVRAYHFLTAQQLATVYYSKGSLTRARTVLKVLYDNEYLDRRAQPHIGIGQPTFVYALARRGISDLKTHGFSFFSRFRPGTLHTLSALHLDHVLRLNDVLIAAKTLSRLAPDISLEEWRHDLDLKHTPGRVEYIARTTTGERFNETLNIVPDGWLDFRLNLATTKKQLRKCLALELDRGTGTYVPKVKKKFRAYVHYSFAGGGYSRTFGTNKLTIAYATTAGQNRVQTLKRWCEEALHEQGLEQEASLFRFALLPPGEIDAKHLFLAPIWYKPFEKHPMPLLWNPKSSL